jgi:hypothetical protein
MKKVFFGKNILLLVVITAILTTVSINKVMASGGNPPSKEIPVQISYLGEKNLLPVFELLIDNEGNNDYSIIIKDELGNILHVETANTTKIVRKYGLDASYVEMAGTIFEITNKTTGATHVYKISTEVKKEENITVSRVYSIQ